jgi:CRISPR type I-E-associated protein CasB/Cse2
MTERSARFDVGEISREWWNDINGTGTRRGRDRAAFAELRRSADPLDIAFVPAFDRLRRRLGAAATDEWGLRKAARIANLLAHIVEDDRKPVARALGSGAEDNPAVMSEARFRRLLQAEDQEDLLRRLTRAVKMLKGKANIGDLAQAAWYWNDRIRQRWAFTYLGAEPPVDGRDAA